MLTPEGSDPFSVFSKIALAESSGKSPVSVMLLALHTIERGAKFIFGAPRLPDGPSVANAPDDAEREPSNSPYPIAAINNGMTTTPISQGRLSERQRDAGACRESVAAAVWPERTRAPTGFPSPIDLPRLVRPAGDMQPTEFASRHRLRRAH
jgi:hypothetical protein